MPDVSGMVDRLLRYERAPVVRTKRFRTLAHNADLCPRLQIQLETLLCAYGKYETITYDTQGLSDDGADVVVSIPPLGIGRRRIGFQVKSFSDLEHPNWLLRLKAQHTDAFNKVQNLHDYYIVLCTDHSSHIDKVRQVTAEFRDAAKTIVVEPQYAWTFLTLPEYRIDAHVKRSLDEQDVVLRDARLSLDLPTPTAKVLAIHACAAAVFESHGSVDPSSLVGAPHLRGLYNDVISGLQEQILAGTDGYDPDDADIARVLNSDVEELIADDLESLGDNLFSIDHSTGALTPDVDQLMPVIALLADTLARHGTTTGRAVSYLADLMGIPLPTAPEEWERSG